MGDTNSKKHTRKLGNSPPSHLYVNGHDDDIPSLSSTLASSVTGGSFSTPPSYALSARELQAMNNGRGISISPSTPKEWEKSYKGYLSQQIVDADGKEGVLGIPDIDYQASLHEKMQKKSAETSRSCSNFPQYLTPQDQNHSYSEQTAAKADKAVHGGKLFKSLFGKKDRSKSDARQMSNGKYHSQNVKDSLDQSSVRSKSYENMGGASMAAYRMRQPSHIDDCAIKGGSIFEPKGTVIGPGGVVRTYNQGAYVGMNSHDTSDADKARKLKFTEMHNSTKGGDTKSAYLGEDKSIHHGQNFVAVAQPSASSPNGKSSPNEYMRSQRGIVGHQTLTSVTEDESALSKKRILKPIEGAQSWSKNGDHLIVPAIMEMSPRAAFSFVEELEHSYSNGDTLAPEATPEASGNSLAFGKFVLGKATQVKSKTSSPSVFVLRQNYLFEFEERDNLNSRPRGLAFLQDSLVCIINDVIQLEYYERSNKSRSKMRKILLHVEPNDARERERWATRLREAAQLRIEHLYEYDASKGGKELGKGRYATIRPGRRRRNNSDQSRLGGENMSASASGIMKKVPSFSSLANSIPSPLMKCDYECALKIVDKAAFWERVKKGKERIDAIVREISVQAALMTYEGSAQNSLRILGFFETFDYVVLELELLEGNDLFQHISMRGTLTETEAADMMFDILTCLAAMYKAGVAHRDLKPANILMREYDKDGKVKLGDFGMATFVGKDNLVYGRCGTPGYVAPEILLAGKNAGYANNVDVFSAGVILYVLLCGYEPFYGESEKELIKDNKEAIVEYPENEWKSISIEGRDLIEKMLQRDPETRITPSKALLHPWITRRAPAIKNDEPHQFSSEGIACCIN